MDLTFQESQVLHDTIAFDILFSSQYNHTLC